MPCVLSLTRGGTVLRGSLRAFGMLNDRCDDPVPIRRVQFMAAAVDAHHGCAGDRLG